VISAVLDTNTIVSATIVPQGMPAQILQAGCSQLFRWVTSSVIIDEVSRTLHRPRIRRRYKISSADADRVRDLLERETIVSSISRQVQGVATHPEDDLIRPPRSRPGWTTWSPAISSSNG
jgi:predicted nucleic acid-binding protein